MSDLGRHIEFDERSRGYPIRTLLDLTKPRRSYTWSVGASLDQGNEGACVGFAWTHEAIARPVVVSATNETVRGVYKLAQTLDEWSGEAYEGTSVLAGAKAAMQMNWLDEYRWAFNEEEVALAVGYRGPVVLGMWWWTGMDNPWIDAQGRKWASPTGSKRGGHAFITNGYSVTQNGYKCWNSWGAPSDFWIHKDHMKLLLEDEGEACVPMLRTKP